ncbi:MAG TPA: GxxExxY protein [Gemmataceae bacterium]|jgi:GxxExxY protein
MSNSELLHADITALILKGFYHVYNTLGYGFLEKVYENALKITLRKWGLSVSQQQPIKVYFEGEEVGEYFADLIVAEKVILELKTAESICSGHESQLVNYLKATDIEVGLLLNFGPKPEFRRKIFCNDRKTCKRE